MTPLRNRLYAAITLFAGAAVCTGLAVALSNASEQAAPDLAELRDAVNTAAKRGDNVDEIRTAVDALDNSLKNGWTAPEAGKTVEPSPELLAVHKAVESAARKGENVEEIRKQLESVEKALIGKTISRPKPIAPKQPPVTDPFDFPPPVQFPGQAFPLPVVPGGDGVDREVMQKARELLRQASEMIVKNPNDPEAKKRMQEAHDLMLKAVVGGRGMFAPGFNPNLNFPDLGRGRIPERFRLGVRLEQISELAADQLGLDVARGVGISDVVEGSPAAKAGFKTHDIILEFAGKPVSDNPEEFTRLVATTKGQGKVNAIVLRKGKKVEITGIELPEVAQEFPRLDAGGGFPLPERRPALRPALPAPPMINGNPLLKFSSVAVSDVDGQVTIKAVNDGVQYEIRGERNGNQIDLKNVVITEGDKKTEADKLDKLPESYRVNVEKLLKSSQVRNSRP